MMADLVRLNPRWNARSRFDDAEPHDDANVRDGAGLPYNVDFGLTRIVIPGLSR
jgi:hypothetical protein